MELVYKGEIAYMRVVLKGEDIYEEHMKIDEAGEVHMKYEVYRNLLSSK